MKGVFIELKSAWIGLRSLQGWPSDRRARDVSWAVRRFEGGGWWIHLWTPVYHEGRGPYLSAGAFGYSIHRGY